MKKIMFVMSSLSIISLSSALAFADDDLRPEPICREVKARIVSTYSSAECASPIHLCTVGKITGDGIRGDSDYTADSLGTIQADLHGRSAYSYNGNLVVTTKHGQLMISDLGVLDETGFSFSELSLNVSGTGKFQGATGHIYFFGTVSQTGFIGDMRGTLCSNADDLD